MNPEPFETIFVQPGGPDRRVPRENQHGAWFEPNVPTQVRLTDWVQRRLRDGDLVKVDPPAPPPPVKTTSTKGDS